MEINSEIRVHLPVWRQKLLNILEEVEQERKSKENIKTRIKSETEPSEENRITVRGINKKPGCKTSSRNACRRNMKIGENRIGSLQRPETSHRLIAARKYCGILTGQTNGLEKNH
ncbi:MAG: hypothetical protein WA364_14815 [Candidatus Nitrosopolaris sp.]